MKINKLQSNLSFKKALQARCTVMTNNKEQIPCSIYKLEPDKDKNYFYEIKNKKDWEGAKHFDMVAINNKFLKQNSPFSIFTMESQKGDFLGFAQICDFDEELDIISMETAPALTSRNNKTKSGLKYVGENFISFFAQLAKKNFKAGINIEADSSSIPFYSDKYNFQNYLSNPVIDDEPIKLSLSKYQFTDLLEKNKKHTSTGVILTI